MENGRIIKALAGFYYVDTGEDVYECKARGIFRKEKITPLVGDKVKMTITDTDTKKGVVEKVEKRKNELIRPPVANIDQAVLVFAVKNPSPNLSLIDRFIVLAEIERMEILICFNKIDLDENGEYQKLKEIYENAGYKVIAISTKTKENIDEVVKSLKGRVNVLSGPSGAGKSSLINTFSSEFALKTSDVSEKIGRGRHTTRHAELLRLGEKTLVADTPGFSSLTLNHLEYDELKDYFIEFASFDEDCRFGQKCLHDKEPNCGIKQAVENGEISSERYESYLQLMDEIKNSRNRRY